jgi:phosphoribosyl 1,2-cyclic phosphodiesterase
MQKVTREWDEPATGSANAFTDDDRCREGRAPVELTFLGTRGEIEARSLRHARHSVLLVNADDGRRALVDFGRDWLDDRARIAPDAILLTHAHVDHAGGLRQGAPCPVYATADTWRAIARWPIADRAVVVPREPLAILGLEVEAFRVEHSLRAPAVGYRLSGSGATVFYVPDVLSIPEQRAALAGVDVYIGDGASLTRSIVRRRDGVGIGHASIRQQLDWCAAERVGRALFTHCGTQLVRDATGEIAERVVAMGADRGVEAAVADDGARLVAERDITVTRARRDG